MNARWVIATAAIAVALSPTHAQTTTSTTISTSNQLLAANTNNTLPIDNGDWPSLGLLASTANLSTPAAGGSGDAEADLAAGNTSTTSSGLTYGGITPTQNDTTLDGLSLQQNFHSRAQGSSSNQATFGQSAILAFRVMPQTYSAQFGDAAGAVLSITSRTPANAWHGSVFSTLRNSALDATNPFSVVTHYRNGVITNTLVKPNDTILRLGGHISIPLRRHLAAFLSWDEMLRNDPAIASPALATFYALTPSQTSLLANRGVTSADTNAALNYLDSLTGTVPRHSTRALGFLRIDSQLSKRNHLALTYTRNRIILPAGSGVSSASNAVVNSGIATVGDSFLAIDAAAAHWQHDFSPKLRNILRAQFVRDLEYETPHTPLPQEPSIAPGGFSPEVEIAPNGFTYGTPANLGRSAYPDEKRIQATEQISWAHRKHLLTAGFDWSRIDDRIASLTNPNGTFLYDSPSAGGLADWITDYTFNVNAYPNGGCPSIHATVHDFCFRSYTQNFGPQQTEFITHTFDGYLEDAIRAAKSLQLTFGIRYQYILLPFPQTPNTALDANLQTLATQFQGTTASFPEDRNNIAPRIALAWSPHHAKWFTAHLGYGWFYGRLPGTTVRAALTDTASTNSTLQIRIRPTTITLCPQITIAQQGFGYPCSFLSTPPSAVAETSDVLLFAKNFRLPAVQRATLSLERGIGKHIFLRASYAMALAAQLPTTTDLNIAPSTSLTEFTLQTTAPHPGIRNGETFVVPLYTTRRLTQYGPITALISTANETYHSGTLEAELRDWHGLSLRGSFTFSRAIDYAPQISGTPQQNGQFDPFRNGYDKGLSTLNFPQRFTGDAIWRAPEKSGPRWLRHTLHNIRIAAIATAGTGAPYSYEISGGTYLSGGRESINGSGGATYLPTIGRNTLHLPPRGNVDLRLERAIDIHKNIRLSAFAEAFNLLNERNLTRIETRAFLPEPANSDPPTGCPTTPIPALVFQDAATIACEGLTTPAFGQPTSSTSGVTGERDLQLGLRLNF